MKIGVIGYGSIGKRHAANATALGHEVRYFDPVLQGECWFEEEIYNWSDAVVIASPSTTHVDHLMAAVQRGKHALIEKPISSFIDNCLPVTLENAARRKLVVMMGNNLRFHPCVQQAKAWIDAGEIGVPIWAHFTCAAKSVKPLYLSDGVILNTGAHEVDMALHLLGPARVINASARIGLRPGTANSDVNAMLCNCDDIADFLLQHDNGCRSSFHLDFVTRKEMRDFRIVGGESDLYCELPQRFIVQRRPDTIVPNYAHFKPFNAPDSYDTDYLDEMRAFVDRIEGKDVPGATGHDGLATLDILLDIRSKAGVAPR